MYTRNYASRFGILQHWQSFNLNFFAMFGTQKSGSITVVESKVDKWFTNLAHVLSDCSLFALFDRASCFLGVMPELVSVIPLNIIFFLMISNIQGNFSNQNYDYFFEVGFGVKLSKVFTFLEGVLEAYSTCFNKIQLLVFIIINTSLFI